MTRCEALCPAPSAGTPISVGRGRDQRLEQVDVVVVVHALQDGGDALEPHAGVDRGLRQVDAVARAPRCSYCMKTRFQISMKRSPSASALPGGPPGILSPWSKKISEHGPQGPVSPMRQKLSWSAMRMIRSSGRPAIFFQIVAASSSS